MVEQETKDRTEQALREIIHYSTIIEKIIKAKLEDKINESRKLFS